MENLIDLGALQPTGDMSSVWPPEYRSYMVPSCLHAWGEGGLVCVSVLHLISAESEVSVTDIIVLTLLGEEICEVFLGQFAKSETRSGADFGCYRRGM